MPEEDSRSHWVDMKLAVLPEVVKGKRVIAVDDSIVRGNTAARRVQYLREAGAKEVHMRISCPPIKHPCFYGIDFPTKEELIASSRTTEDMKKLLGVDSLEFISLEGLLSPFNKPDNFCTACFRGNYPVKINENLNKKALENH
jgi:amidophosphoribosyltransferase